MITTLKMGSESSRVVKMCMNPENMPITMLSRTASNFIELIPTRQFNKYVVKFFWSWILQDYQSSGKEKQSHCLVFMPSTKHEITHTHITVVQHEKHDAHAKLLFCKLKPIVLFSFLLPSPYSLLMLLNNLTVRYSSLDVIVFSVICIKSD